MCVSGIALAVGLWSGACLAQDTPAEIARRELLTQADAARRANDHARALDLATRAGEIRMTPSLRLLIAQAHEALGHPLEALDLAGQCLREAEADPALRNRDQIVLGCRELTVAVTQRIGRVTLRVPSPAPSGLVVRVQRAEVAAALWGVPYPVIAGRVTVDATATGHADFHQDFVLAPGAVRDVEVRLAPASVTAASTTAPNATAAPVTRAGRRPPTPTPVSSPPSFAARVGAGPFVVVGVGALALGTAAVFFALRDGAVSDRDAACDVTGCDPSARTLDERARTFNTLTNVSLGVGLAALAGGLIWGGISLGQSGARRDGALRLGASVASNGFALTLGGAL